MFLELPSRGRLLADSRLTTDRRQKLEAFNINHGPYSSALREKVTHSKESFKNSEKKSEELDLLFYIKF